MDNEELMQENADLRERIRILENIINRGNRTNANAYSVIRGMIIEKVEKEVDLNVYEDWTRKQKRQQFERQLMQDLLWEIRVRRVAELRNEHIKQAEEFINKYKFEN